MAARFDLRTTLYAEKAFKTLVAHPRNLEEYQRASFLSGLHQLSSVVHRPVLSLANVLATVFEIHLSELPRTSFRLPFSKKIAVPYATLPERA